jgi:hypothetical protein
MEMGPELRDARPGFASAGHADADATAFILPSPAGGAAWRLAAETGLRAPFDICAPGEESSLSDPTGYRVDGQSSVVLVACANEAASTALSAS